MAALSPRAEAAAQPAQGGGQHAKAARPTVPDQASAVYSLSNSKMYSVLYEEVFKHWTMDKMILWRDQDVSLDHVKVIPREPFLRHFGEAKEPLPRHQDLLKLYPTLFVTMAEVDDPEEVSFVSHRWESKRQPDPRASQLRMVVAILRARPDIKFIWCDFWCLPQVGEGCSDDQDDRTDEEKAYFQRVLLHGLRNLNLKTKFVPLWNCDDGSGAAVSGQDYLNRGWCFAELMWGRDRMVIVAGINDPGPALQKQIDMIFAQFLGRAM